MSAHFGSGDVQNRNIKRTRRRLLLVLTALFAMLLVLGIRFFLSYTSDSFTTGILRFDPKHLSATSYLLGPFTVVWNPEQGGRLVVNHQDSPGHVVWSTLPGIAFAAAGQGCEKVTESHGSFDIRDTWQHVCTGQTIDSIVQCTDRVVITGALTTDERGTDSVGYEFSLELKSPHQLAFSLSFTDSRCNRAWLTYASEPDEHFFGFGEQFSCFDLKGKRVPVFVQEQGIGRGLQPITFLANLVAGAGGSWSTSYACVPHYITSKMRSAYLDNTEYSVFDLRKGDRVQVHVFASRLNGRILQGGSPAELIEEYTSCVGRMRPLPDWILDGAVVGMQGGTEKVRNVCQALKEHDAPVAAFWLQDWVGPRKTSIGKQLWWNWEVDEEHYLGWQSLVDDLRADGVRMLTYVNPFLVDVAEKSGAKRNLFKEAVDKKFLVCDSSGSPCLIPNTSFSAGLLDLTNPAACLWMKDVIRNQIIGAGASGWMADFGEALPYNARLHSGQSAASFHNEYPEAWGRLNREVIEETGQGEDFVFFTRSGYRSSPRYTTLNWLGDQLVTWDACDGMKTAVTGLLSSGLSGFSFNHSDIGGYTTFSKPLLKYRRDKELLMRWAELNAFTTIYRTHEGNQPEANAQFYSDEETLEHFARFAKVYKAWAFYRKQLVQEAGRTGLPVVRHLFIHYPDDPNTFALSYQEFLVGTDLLVVPVLDAGRKAVDAYFPKGRWVHVWTGETYGDAGKGIHQAVAAPIGKPTVFYKDVSNVGPQFTEHLRNLKILD